MKTIREMLSQVRWDPRFRGSRFEIGYLDRVAGRILRVPFEDVRFDAGDDFSFVVVDGDGSEASIPLHRVRKLYINGRVLWERPGDASRPE